MLKNANVVVGRIARTLKCILSPAVRSSAAGRKISNFFLRGIDNIIKSRSVYARTD